MEPRNRFQGMNLPAYVARRASTITLFGYSYSVPSPRNCLKIPAQSSYLWTFKEPRNWFRPAYVAWWAGMTTQPAIFHRLAESIPGHKLGLCICYFFPCPLYTVYTTILVILYLPSRRKYKKVYDVLNVKCSGDLGPGPKRYSCSKGMKANFQT